MSRYYYDFHIHSCLSPCGDDEMTPANIAGMAVVNGLNIVALTDHNSSKNCPAFFKQAKKLGIIPVAGMELTTAEDIHVVCLFERLEDAMAFGEAVDALRDKFGEDIIRRGKFAQSPGEHMAGGLDKARRTGITKPLPREAV